MKVLITGGGSQEPIDNVRFVTNFSTGRTASFLADSLTQKGVEVTAVLAEAAIKPENREIHLKEYKSYADLKAVLEEECKNGNYDAIIHAAAVSDYSPECVEVDGKVFKAGGKEKLPAGKELVIRMKKNPKLIDFLKQWAGRNTKVIGFKLTSNADTQKRLEAVRKIFGSNSDRTLAPDFIVSNDKTEINGNSHPWKIYRTDETTAAEGSTLEQMAEGIFNLLQNS